MPDDRTADLDIVVPVYREAATIEATLRAIHAAVSGFARHHFIIAIDEGGDDTRAIVERVGRELPIRIDASAERRRYSGAMRAGLARVTAPFVLCIDSDGQYDPADIARLWAVRDSADVVSGCRVQRADTEGRRLGSAAFGAIYRALFPVPLRDPSSSLVLTRRAAAMDIARRSGHLPEGFWWEFNAIAYQLGLSFREIEVRHLPRAGGATQVYSPARLPGVIWRQATGLARLAARRRSLRT